MSLKKTIKRFITRTPFLASTLSMFAPPGPRIFVYHRFSEDKTASPHVIDRDTFSWQLDQISKRHKVITFAEMLECLRDKRKIPRNTVVLTVDDGYSDFEEIAFPLLEQRAIPATFFVTSDFVEGKIWLWPDKIDYLINNADEGEFVCEKYGLSFDLRDEGGRFSAWKSLSDICIDLEGREKDALIEDVGELVGVELPATPVDQYRPVSWSSLKKMVAGGVEVGSHTVTHPILSKIPTEAAVGEVFDSKTIIEDKLGIEVKTFCYPNSRPVDVTAAVLSAVEEAGYLGAVLGIGNWEGGLYSIPRIGVSRDKTDFLWKLYGFEQYFYS